jgi:LysM repeat protein
MSFFGRLNPGALGLAVLLALNGCSPMDSSQTNEEKEPHFVLGNSRFNEMDFSGAVEAFEESLEVNPHSAQAHYRLAQIFDSKVPDPAAAIYHYQEYLKLSADVNNRDVIEQRIESCKQQLAADVLQLPSAPAVQRQLDALIQQNRQLQAQVDQLNGIIRQWSAYCASLQTAARGNPANPAAVSALPAASGISSTPDDISAQSSAPAQPQPQPQLQSRATPAPLAKPAPAKTEKRTHIVSRGETLASIARKAGVSLAALRAANPELNPKKLRVGEPLNLPP